MSELGEELQLETTIMDFNENAIFWADDMISLFGDSEQLANVLDGAIIHPAAYLRIKEMAPEAAKLLRMTTSESQENTMGVPPSTFSNNL